MPFPRAAVLAVVFLLGCQTERWGVPTSGSGFPTGSHNYSRWAADPPRMLFLQPITAPDTSGCLQPPLALSSRLTVLATAEGSLIGLGMFEPIWHLRLPAKTVAAVPLVADSGTLYLLGSDGTLSALSFDGKLLWREPLFLGLEHGGGPYLPLLAQHRGILAADGGGRLVRVAATGKILWEQRRGGSLRRSWSASADGLLALGIAADGGDTLLVLDSTGQQRWSRVLPQTQLTCVVLGNGRLVVAGVRDGPQEPIPVLHCFSAIGELLWSKTLPAVPRWVSLDDSSRAYVIVHSSGVGDPISGILAYGADGHHRWKLYLPATITTPALLFEKSLLVFAVQSNGALGGYILSLADGSLQELLSLQEAPPLLLVPAVTPDGDVLLGWSTRLGLLRLGEHPWRWLLF